MSKNFCKDCGMLLSPKSTICTVCGFENNFDQDQALIIEKEYKNTMTDDHVPSYKPGF
ncbi:MAG: hypothetical protein GY729_08615 [Desulfobacteraceae bacterium]|nr:hypothetical protein [Desulfobacteraceae bacterium]